MMQYTCEIVIEKPLELVLKLFNNPENVIKWMDGLKSYTLIEGVGYSAKSRYQLEYRFEKVEQ